MPYYRAIGEFPRKRHVRFRRPDGGLYAEELMGEEGFSSDSSLLYHRYLPTAIVKSERKRLCWGKGLRPLEIDQRKPSITPTIGLKA